ncbi:hypothetical protein [Micromonospora sp. U56]|uniref:hypothetical protein n=1 Tax=Micromonospora sp. U56 TaxID=2824900 RepID=UPI001FFDAB77|nr:hypothetical protein [Micromonospora sp. U56]
MSRRVAPCRSIRVAGIEPSLARFAATHASWGTTAVELEDLLVSLADKIWKAKRVPDLEQLVVDRLAAASGEEPWQAFLNLGTADGPTGRHGDGQRGHGARDRGEGDGGRLLGSGHGDQVVLAAGVIAEPAIDLGVHWRSLTSRMPA